MTVLERTTWRPLVGLRFVDAATGLPVREDLRVTAQVRRVEHELVRSRDGAAWGLHLDPLPPAAPVVVRVTDAARRFLPAIAEVGAGMTTHVLASAPARAVPPGYAEVRATVVQEGPAREPLPGFRLTVTVDGTPATGYADDRGDVLVCLSWPKSAPGVALRERTWKATVAVAGPDVPPARGDAFALDLDATYTAREVALGEQTLSYGAPLVLKTQGADALFVR